MIYNEKPMRCATEETDIRGGLEVKGVYAVRCARNDVAGIYDIAVRHYNASVTEDGGLVMTPRDMERMIESWEVLDADFRRVDQ